MRNPQKGNTRQMSSPQDRDPLAGSDKAPSIGFKNDAIGTVKSIVLDGPFKPDVHQKKFGSDDFDFWPSKNGEPGKPKLAVVGNGTDPNTGQPVSLWLPKPSDLLSKTQEAQKRDLGVGVRADVGVRIDVKLVDREDVGKGNPANRHAVRMTPAAKPDALGSSDDPWASAPAAAPVEDAPPF